MKDFKKIFLDTSPIIYLLDNDKNFGEKTAEIFPTFAKSQVFIRNCFLTLIKIFDKLILNLIVEEKDLLG